jgi:hypothetical protein
MESHATEITHFFFGQPFRLTALVRSSRHHYRVDARPVLGARRDRSEFN